MMTWPNSTWPCHKRGVVVQLKKTRGQLHYHMMLRPHGLLWTQTLKQVPVVAVAC